MSSLLNSVFNIIHKVKINCPSCKEKIVSHAKKCPYCQVDLASYEFVKNTEWQKIAHSILMFFVGIVMLMLLFSTAGLIETIIVGAVLYGIGHFIILKMQSILNLIK